MQTYIYYCKTILRNTPYFSHYNYGVPFDFNRKLTKDEQSNNNTNINQNDNDDEIKEANNPTTHDNISFDIDIFYDYYQSVKTPSPTSLFK